MLRSQIVGKVRSRTAAAAETDNYSYYYTGTGTGSGKSKRTPAPVRNLARLLEQLPPPPSSGSDGISSILLTAAHQSLPSKSKIRSRVEATLSPPSAVIPRAAATTLRGRRKQQQQQSQKKEKSELEIAAAVHRAFHCAFSASSPNDDDSGEETAKAGGGGRPKKRRRKTSGYNIFFAEYSKQIADTTVVEKAVVGAYPKFVSRAWNDLPSQAKSRYALRAKQVNDHDDNNGAGKDGMTCSLMVFTTSPAAAAAMTTKAAAKSQQHAQVVSDSESGSPSSTTTTTKEETSGSVNNDVISPSDLWSAFMESVHLHVVSARATSATLKPSPPPSAASGGAKTRRKASAAAVYEVYRLAGPAVLSYSRSSIGDLQRRVQRGFLAVFDGCSAEGGGRPSTTTTATKPKLTRQARLLMRDCRVHAVWQQQQQQQQSSEGGHQNSLWIQINVGRSGSYAEDATVAANNAGGGAKSSVGLPKKSKKFASAGAEFIAVVVPESNRIALATTTAAAGGGSSTGSGALASRSRYTSLIVSALESALTCTSAEEYSDIDVFSRRVDGMSGPDPYDLLWAARCSTASGPGVVGRFAHYNAKGKKSDPIAEMQKVATAPLLSKKDGMSDDEGDGERQAVDTNLKAQGGRSLARLCDQVSAASNGQSRVVAAVNGGSAACGGGVIIDHSAGTKQRRKRTREAAFGRDGDCPRIGQLRWEWKGETSAASACWMEDDDNSDSEKNPSQDDASSLPKDRFKCRVTMQGSDVFAGLQALVDAGFATAPLPGYVRDAPGMGGTIRVEDGAVVRKCTD